MKRILVFALAALFICASAMAQEGKQEKKKGGFLSGLKKAVESTTGLDVSNEAVFVYPKIGEWKMSVESCIGNKELGTVKLKLKVTRFEEEGTGGAFWLMEAKTTDGVKLGFAADSELRYKFQTGVTQIVEFQTIAGVPENAKAINIKFKYLYHDAIEGRDIPIEWKEPETK